MAEYPDLSKITLMSQSMKNLYALATKVIRLRCLVLNRILSSSMTDGNRALQSTVLEFTRHSSETIEHIANAILERNIRTHTLIQNLNSSKYILEIFSSEFMEDDGKMSLLKDINDLLDELTQQTLSLDVHCRSSAFQLLQGNVYPLHSLESLKSDAVMLLEPAPYPLRTDSMLTKLRVSYTGFKALSNFLLSG